MKKSILSLIFILITTFGYTQVQFEPGYFIDNSGKRTQCLVKNFDWKNNPDKISYKIEESDKVQTIGIDNVQEFGIQNESKYVRAEIGIDRSTDNFSSLSNHKAPDLEIETLFLKVLIEGKASLYSYSSPNFRRFFYKVDDAEIEQLIFKYYKISSKERAKNIHYINQLWTSMKCDGMPYDEYKYTEYRRSDLIKIFRKYNECQNSELKDYTDKPKKKIFSLSLRPGLSVLTYEIESNLLGRSDVSFDAATGFRIGAELEFSLPFNKRKWSLLVEPSYHTYQASTEVRGFAVDVEYNRIELPLGVRYYSYLNPDSRIFIDLVDILAFPGSSSVEFERDTDLGIVFGANLAISLGYSFKEKYSFAVRYGSGRNLIGRSDSFSSDFSELSFIVGVKLLK